GFTFGEANYNSLPCCSKNTHERSTRPSTLDNVSFEGANHWVQNDPAKFYAEVDKFITAVTNSTKT
ncbi:hypothetical protein AB6C82_07400, partial [Vibrio splendidus]